MSAAARSAAPSASDLSAAVFRPASTGPFPSTPVRTASSILGFRDRLGALAVRWGFGRDRYRVEPGLYALGAPLPEAPVLVTANYKLSFDLLRKELAGIDAWMLALDTRGVNVWCAAGKGTFGTEELVARIGAVGLSSRVSGRVLVLPQLGAPGVAAHEVARRTGFRVVYGPVRARDLSAFLAAGMKKTAAMSRVEFGLGARMAVAPVELSRAWPFLAAALVLAIVLPSFLSGGEGQRMVGSSAAASARLALLFASPIPVGALLFPALLPVLPFRPFALKGAVLGLVWSMGLAGLLGLDARPALAYVLAASGVVSFMAMNFTGSSTYTNLTGAAREVRLGLPIQAAAALGGVLLALAGVLGS